jgi:hypothetical protein
MTHTVCSDSLAEKLSEVSRLAIGRLAKVEEKNSG